MHDRQVYPGLRSIHQTGATRLQDALKLRPVRFLVSLEMSQDVHLSPNSAHSQTYMMNRMHSTMDRLALLCTPSRRPLDKLYSPQLC